MNAPETEDKLRTRSPAELALQMEGLVVLKAVLNAQLERWFLSGGTLLGVHRDGDFIPWDWDVEVTVLTEEALPKESDLLQALMAAGFVISQCDSTVENFKIVADGWGTKYEMLGRHLKDGGHMRARLLTEVPAEFFLTQTTVAFRGHEFPAPSPIDGYLQALYGDWRTPIKTADKAAYLSPVAYRKHTRAQLVQRFVQLENLLRPLHVQAFPKVTQAEVDAFRSWDRELGWCNPPRVTRMDQADFFSHSVKNVSAGRVFSTDNQGSRRCAVPNAKASLACYGDSYCMGRGVADQETFAWLLGEQTQTRVANYGVAHHGLDQAWLRLQRDHAQDPADTVLLTVSSSGMSRCVSMYRHFQASGETLAVKPRFVVGEGGELQTLRAPIDHPQDLLHLRRHEAFFRQHDGHWSVWQARRWRYFLSQVPQKVLARLGLCARPEPMGAWEDDSAFWENQEPLFMAIMDAYQRLAQQRGFRPVFLLQHSRRHLDRIRAGQPDALPWAGVMARAAQRFSAVTFLDSGPWLAAHDPLAELFVGSHPSPLTHRLLAERLKAVLSDVG